MIVMCVHCAIEMDYYDEHVELGEVYLCSNCGNWVSKEIVNKRAGTSNNDRTEHKSRDKSSKES